MTFIPNGFGQAVMEFTIPGPGGPAMCVFGYDSDLLQGPDADATDISDAYSASGSLSSRVDSNTILTEVRTLVRLNTGELVSGLDTQQKPGLASGTGASPQVAALLQKLTGLAGRNRRGRMYLPGALAVGETGVWNAANLTALSNAAGVFLAQLSTLGVPMVLLHESTVDPPNTIIELRGSSVVGTQRRRIR